MCRAVPLSSLCACIGLLRGDLYLYNVLEILDRFLVAACSLRTCTGYKYVEVLLLELTITEHDTKTQSDFSIA
jgi:hypothetical protein